MQEPRRTNESQKKPSEFLHALRNGALIGAGLLLVVIPVMRMVQKDRAPEPPPQVATAPQPAAPSPVTPPAPNEGTAAAPQAPAPAPAPSVRLADFRGEDPSPEARLVANWAAATRDHKKHAFVLIDKKDARVYVFSPDGKLQDSAPALLGSAHGDDSFPGIGDKPLSAIRPEEKTTPAGRFVAEPGRNTNNEDIVWVDYDAAVSMHRIRPTVARERRLERLASLTTDDNRISFGCINLPVRFYEDVLSPTVQKYGAIVYVLPEVKSAHEVFGAYDVTGPKQAEAARSGALRKVALKR